MSTSAESLGQSSTTTTVAFSGFERRLRNRLIETMRGLQGGTMVLHDALGSATVGMPNGHEPLLIHVSVHSPEFYRQVAMNGSVGAGEAYMEGHWTCSDLVALVRLLVRNRDLLDGMEPASRAWAASQCVR